MDLIPEEWTNERSLAQKCFFFHICVPLCTVFLSDAEQMFVSERLYFLLLFNLCPRAVPKCTLGLQAEGTNNDGVVFNSSLLDQSHSGFCLH